MSLLCLVGSALRKGRHLLPLNIRQQKVTAFKALQTIRMLTPGLRLPELPVTTKLNLSGESVILENLESGDFREAFQLVESAARRGDNVGIDEFPDNIGDFSQHLRGSSAFAIRSIRNRTLIALIVLGSCPSARTINPCLASLQIMTSESFACDSFWRDSADIAIDFLQRLPFGYSACVTSVFTTCVDRLAALRKEGFVVCARVPMAGKLAVGKDVAVDSPSYLMYKEVGPADDARPSLSQLIQLSKELTGSAEADELLLRTPSPPIPGLVLPMYHFLPNIAMNVVFRQLQPEEVGQYYGYFRSSGGGNEGFSSEEFPTISFFWHLFRHYHNIVVAERNSGKWLAIFCVSRSPFARSRCPEFCDGSLIVSPEFRSTGIGSQLLPVYLEMLRRMGFRMIFSDTPIYYTTALTISYGSGLTFSGTLPRAIHSPTHGWSDVVLLHKNLE